MDFKKLGEVATVEEILDTDTVLVARDGQIYRADKSKVGGGAGGYLLEPADDEIVAKSGEDGSYYITTKIDDMLKAVEAGAAVTIKMDGSHILDGLTGVTLTIATVLNFTMGGEYVEQAMPGIKLFGGAYIFDSEAMFAFTNGGPVPSTDSASTASVNALSALVSKLRNKPVVEAADGVD